MSFFKLPHRFNTPPVLPTPAKQNPKPAQGSSSAPEAPTARPAAPPPCKPVVAPAVNKPSDNPHYTPDGTNVDMEVYMSMTPEQQKAHDHELELKSKAEFDALPEDKKKELMAHGCPATDYNAMMAHPAPLGAV